MQNQIDPCLTTEEAARELELLPGQIRALIRARVFDAEKINGRWCIRFSKLHEFKSRHHTLAQLNLLVTDTGMLEISIGLTGVSAAIMTIVPNTLTSDFIRAIIYWTALVVGFVSLYSSLWLLGEYAEDKLGLVIKRWEDKAGLGHILSLLSSPQQMGPYWLLTVSLVFLFIVLIIVGYASAF